MIRVSKPWTEEDICILKDMRNTSYTNQQIADRLGRTKKAVLQEVTKLGLANGNQPRTWSEEKREQLRNLIENGATLDSASVAMGVSRSTISGQVDRLGLKLMHPPGTPKKMLNSAFPTRNKISFVAGIKQGEKHRIDYKARAELPKPLAPDSKPVSLLHVRESQCKFPLWPDAKDGGPDFLVCGAHAHRYCDFHTKLIEA